MIWKGDPAVRLTLPLTKPGSGERESRAAPRNVIRKNLGVARSSTVAIRFFYLFIFSICAYAQYFFHSRGRPVLSLWFTRNVLAIGVTLISKPPI